MPRKLINSWVVMLVLLITAFALSGCAGKKGTSPQAGGNAGSAATTIRLAHPYNEQHPLHQGVEKFAELVSQKTGGKVIVKVFPNSTLGTPREITEGVKMGSLDMGLIPTTNVAVYYNKLDLYYLPFLFQNSEHAYAVADGKVGSKLNEELLRKTGLRTLAMYESGFRQITNSKHSIKAPRDLANLKMRSTDSPINVDTFKALGANTSPMAISEVFTALQQGTMDGQDNPIGNVYAFGYYKAQKYLTLTRHQWAGIMLLINDKLYNKLSPAYQKALQEAAAESANWQRKEINKQEAGYLDLMKKEGLQVNELTPDGRTQFQNRMHQVWEKYQGPIGKDLIQEAMSTK